MTDYQKVHNQLLSYPQSRQDFPFGPTPAVYRVKFANQDKMFALLTEQNGTLRLSLKCDPQLAVVLRDKYESVMPGYHLSKKHWNTIILSEQLSWAQVVDLIEHSYQLVVGQKTSLKL